MAPAVAANLHLAINAGARAVEEGVDEAFCYRHDLIVMFSEAFNVSED